MIPLLAVYPMNILTNVHKVVCTRTSTTAISKSYKEAIRRQEVH